MTGSDLPEIIRRLWSITVYCRFASI